MVPWPLNPAGYLNGCPAGCKVNTRFTATATAVRIDRGPRALGNYFGVVYTETCSFQAGMFHG